MHWNSSRNPNEQKAGTRQRLLAILAAQGVLTEALLERAHDDSDDDDVLEIEITDFEGCLGDDDDIADDPDETGDGEGEGEGEIDELDDGRVEFDHLDEDEAEEDADEEENEASGSGRRPAEAQRPESSREPGDRRGKKRQSQ